MANDTTKLTEDEVLQILKLIEDSSFDFMQLEFGELKLTVSKTGYAGPMPAQSLAPNPAPQPAPAPEPKIAEAQAPTAPRTQAAAARDGAVPINAPMVGTFYTTPAPGAPPFVQLGDAVNEEATVGLIEVMKVFNAVTAGVKGVIAEICIQNGQFVEYGQPLFFVKPG
jgi:acetyl-CoA carboxylase biotin carboxyl carrier protein